MWLTYHPLIFYITALYSKTLGFVLIGNDRICDSLVVLVVLRLQFAIATLSPYQRR